MAQAVKVDCYVFDGINACPLPCLRQQQHWHHPLVIVIIVLVMSFSSDVAEATPHALKVDCYIFHGVGVRHPPWLQRWQLSPYHQRQNSVDDAFFSGCGLIL